MTAFGKRVLPQRVDKRSFTDFHTLASLTTPKEARMESINHAAVHDVLWNKGKLVGEKAPLKQREIWAIRIRPQLQRETRELALFNLAIDSKLRSRDLV